jgi:hypothetical protein
VLVPLFDQWIDQGLHNDIDYVNIACPAEGLPGQGSNDSRWEGDYLWRRPTVFDL